MVTKGFLSQKKDPDYPFLDTTQTDAVARYLVLRNILQSHETVRRIEPAGGAGRNNTVRVVTSDRSLVLKQFRDWSANGQAAPAASERFRCECQFYRSARITECVGRALPEVLHQDAKAGCILFEDLGRSAAGAPRLDARSAAALAWFLVGLHHHSQSVPETARYGSADLIRWQRTRLFGEWPESEQAVHGRWHRMLTGRSPAVARALAAARDSLLQPGTSLVHGDFTPGNWIRRAERSGVVDAEFSFFGRPEFDAGTFVAGLLFTRQSAEAIQAGVAVIAKGCFRYEPALVAAFAGAHLCAMLEDGAGRRGTPRGKSAVALIDCAAAAIESGSHEAFVL